jgi:hypothetical protein
MNGDIIYQYTDIKNSHIIIAIGTLENCYNGIYSLVVSIDNVNKPKHKLFAVDNQEALDMIADIMLEYLDEFEREVI